MTQHLVCNPGCRINVHDYPHPAHPLQEGRREWWVQTVLGIFCPKANRIESNKGKFLLRNGAMKRVVESSHMPLPPPAGGWDRECVTLQTEAASPCLWLE